MKFTIELDEKLARKYAEFLGMKEEEYLAEDFNQNEYILKTFKDDIEHIVECALNQ